MGFLSNSIQESKVLFTILQWILNSIFEYWSTLKSNFQIAWAPRETWLGRCNKTMCNKKISSHVSIYINCWMSLLKNIIYASISNIYVRWMNHQPILLAFTLVTNIVQLVTGINIIRYMFRYFKLLHYLIWTIHLNNIKAV